MRLRLFTAHVVMSNAGGAYDARAVVARLRPKFVPKEGAGSAKDKAEARS